MDIRSIDPSLLLANFFIEPAAEDDLDDAGTLLEDVALTVPIPTNYHPGTRQKVLELRRRFEYGYQLHSPHDNRELPKLTQSQKFISSSSAKLTLTTTTSTVVQYVLDWNRAAEMVSARKPQRVRVVLSGKCLGSIFLDGVPYFRDNLFLQASKPFSLLFDACTIAVPCSCQIADTSWVGTTSWPTSALRLLNGGR
jgi:hypothetical protein